LAAQAALREVAAKN
jgi:putative redox protein